MSKRGIDPAYYRRLWETMQVRPEYKTRLSTMCDKLVAQQHSYVRAERLTRVPQELFGLTHAREASCAPSRQILNGEPWNQRTTLVPKGLGPWPSWEAAAATAAERQKWTGIKIWNVPVILALLERHNGLGYYYKGLNSPYIWAGTNHQQSGKYVADGKFDYKAWDEQLGCALLWRGMLERGVWSLTTPLQSLEEYNAI